ncbi:MAG: plasma-membrane proton-efflux P-type ATPase [Promethearchaeota archaeon]
MSTTIPSTKESNDLTIDELYESLESSPDGLSSKEANSRFDKYGPNELLERRVNPILKFLRYFWGPIPFMIEAAMILSVIVQHWPDFWIITLMLVMNGIVGFYQENKADNAIEKLKERLSPTARVLRDGAWKQVPAREVVPGDIVRVRPGDVVPADLKLSSGDYLSVDQSALTGESLPADKKVGDVSFQGSPVQMGEMDGLAINTGMNTYYGKTAKLVEEAVTKSHFEKIILKIGDYLIGLAISAAAVVLVAGIIRGYDILENIRFVLVLTVAAIPVALPAVLSVTMAVGAIALARKGAIVSKLSSIEEMAGVDILCTDKTGTITKNKLTVGDIIPYGEFTEDDVLRFGVMASNREDNDAIDNAIIHRAESVPNLEFISEKDRLDFQPFDPVSKRTEGIFSSSDGGQFKVSKGAPQVIAGLSQEPRNICEKIDEDVLSLAEKGFRALGVAKTDSSETWRFVGILSLFDPPREDSSDTIISAQNMGINVKMVTGDHEAIGKEIASKVGLGQNMALPKDFENVPDEQAEPIVESVDGFAQVFPEHKFRIVSLLQQKNHIVGMTGDGVNDAPALKKADVGIAVEGSTDVAKSAADIVLTGVGISVIVDAIKNSRKIFQRMSNYSIYRIAESIRVILFITASILVFQFYPVNAIMIVLLALLNDLPIITIAYDNVRYSKTPERWNSKMLLGMATYLGIIGVCASFGIFVIGDLVFHLSREVLQSFIYLKLSVAGHLTLLVARTRGPFWTVKPALPLISAIVGTQLVATLITVYGFLLPAMGWWLALFVWGYALVWFLITDALKTFFYKHSGFGLLEES